MRWWTTKPFFGGHLLKPEVSLSYAQPRNRAVLQWLHEWGSKEWIICGLFYLGFRNLDLLSCPKVGYLLDLKFFEQSRGSFKSFRFDLETNFWVKEKLTTQLCCFLAWLFKKISSDQPLTTQKILSCQSMQKACSPGLEPLQSSVGQMDAIS